jgi:hypothetical protein
MPEAVAPKTVPHLQTITDKSQIALFIRSARLGLLGIRIWLTRWKKQRIRTTFKAARGNKIQKSKLDQLWVYGQFSVRGLVF